MLFSFLCVRVCVCSQPHPYPAIPPSLEANYVGTTTTNQTSSRRRATHLRSSKVNGKLPVTKRIRLRLNILLAVLLKLDLAALAA